MLHGSPGDHRAPAGDLERAFRRRRVGIGPTRTSRAPDGVCALPGSPTWVTTGPPWKGTRSIGRGRARSHSGACRPEPTSRSHWREGIHGGSTVSSSPFPRATPSPRGSSRRSVGAPADIHDHGPASSGAIRRGHRVVDRSPVEGREDLPRRTEPKDPGPDAVPLRRTGTRLPSCHLLGRTRGTPESHVRGPRWCRTGRVGGEAEACPPVGPGRGGPGGRVPQTTGMESARKHGILIGDSGGKAMPPWTDPNSGLRSGAGYAEMPVQDVPAP